MHEKSRFTETVRRKKAEQAAHASAPKWIPVAASPHTTHGGDLFLASMELPFVELVEAFPTVLSEDWIFRELLILAEGKSEPPHGMGRIFRDVHGRFAPFMALLFSASGSLGLRRHSYSSSALSLTLWTLCRGGCCSLPGAHRAPDPRWSAADRECTCDAKWICGADNAGGLTLC